MFVAPDARERRWGSKERLDNEDDARERLLDAAEQCFERFGLRRTTIDDVARAAKVSRSTVYRYFDGRGDLIVAAYLRESQAVNDKVRALMRQPGTFPERVVGAMLRSIDAIRTGKYLPLMLSSEGALLASKAITASTAFYEGARDTMGPFFEQAKADGEVRRELELDDFIEWTLRLIFSFAMFDSPAPRSRASLRSLIDTFLVPSLAP
ncbi:MAG TPA: TetR/AcrR family transcriptional regulator [Acidimicrobiia bacterium]|jgi:AcrR family transcriptional regulator